MGGIIGRLFHEFAVTIGVAILVSGFVSLTLTPMLSQPLPASRDHDEQHGRFYQRDRARATSGRSRVYERTLDWVMEHRRADAGVLRGHPRRHGRALHGRCRRASSRATTRASSSRTTEAAQGMSFDAHGAAPASRSRRSSQTDPNVDGFMSSSARRTTRGGEPGAAHHRPQAARRAPLQRRRDRRASSARSWRRSRASRVFVQNPPAIRIGGRSRRRASTSSRCRARDIADALHCGADSSSASCAQLPGLTDVTSDLQIEQSAGAASTSTATAPRRSA